MEIDHTENDIMGSMNGPLGPLLQTRTGESSFVCSDTRERSKTSTRGICAKTPESRKRKNRQTIHDGLSTSTHQHTSAANIWHDPFMQTSASSDVHGPHITRSSSITRAAAAAAQTMNSVRGTLEEIVTIQTWQHARESENAHATPMRSRPDVFSRVPSHIYYTHAQSVIICPFESILET